MNYLDNMDNNIMEEFVVPDGLFEALEKIDYDNNNSNSYMDPDMFSNYDLELNSETMISFLEMENVQEVETVEKKPVFKEQVSRPSVIMKPMKEVKKETVTKVPNLSDILTSCGIEYDLVDSPEQSPVQSPSSIHSDMELEKNQELIDELEDFFMKTDGTPTVVDEEVIDTNITIEELNNAMTTNMTTEDGQNVVIIIAPSSPADSLVSVTQDPFPSPKNSPRNTPSPGYTQDSDPEWSPSPASVSSPPGPMRPRKKYARSKPPQAPTGPYPTDKKERKKAQNRTAAFRYREKMKKQEDSVEEELEALEDKNTNLREQLSEMETEFKYLKKLMMEAGLGSYAAAVKY